MTTTIYRSSDASAPILSGTAGSFAALLYACLVVGYGAKTAAGWAREFSATNKAAFRPASGNRFRLRVDDTGTQEARIVGYEAMSDVDTGTGPFPTSAQVSGGLYVRKSTSADTTPRPWVLVASATGFVFLPDSSGSDWLTPYTYQGCSGQMYFGDLYSYKPSDAYGTIIIAPESSGDSNCVLGMLNQNNNPSYTGLVGHYVAREQGQSGGSIKVGIGSDGSKDSGTIIGSTGMSAAPYPDAVTGGMLIARLTVYEYPGTSTGFYIRGQIPGIWAPLHPRPAGHADTMDGSGSTSGLSFLLYNTFSTSQDGRALVETSNTW